MEAAKPPATMRAKFERPDPKGMRAGGMPSRRIVIIARKNVAMAMPCTSKGNVKAQKLAWAVKPERMKNEAAKARNATVAMIRASIRDIMRAAGGVRSTATAPVGAA